MIAKSWAVKAYKMIDGKELLDEWASGFSHNQADQYFKSLRDTNEFSKIEMKPV